MSRGEKRMGSWGVRGIGRIEARKEKNQNTVRSKNKIGFKRSGSLKIV
jgi:hypothetical protein